MFYLSETANQIDLSQCNYVVDCVDTMAAKIELIKQCHAIGVPIISSMGAANKLDPTRFRVTDINKTEMDPLAKVIRKKLRKLGIRHLKVVFSDEEPRKPFVLDYQESADAVPIDTTSVQITNKKRTIPASNAFVPATAGLIIGGEVVKELIK